MLESFECVDYVVIATPNYLHKEMIEKAYNKVNKGIICEKPLCLSMAELDALEKYRDKIFPVMQLRYSDKLKREREKIKLIDVETIDMEICVRRDDWYFEGWKGDKDKAGKLLYNIGIHYIDILQWFFGRLNDSKIIREEEKIIECMLRFQGGTVKFILDLTAPMDNQRRLLKVNDYVIDLSKGFENMHKKVYENVLSDNPINLEEVYKDIMIIEKIYGNS